jgi:hypothetical protein
LKGRSAEREDIGARYIEREDLDQKAEPVRVADAPTTSSESCETLVVIPTDVHESSTSSQ